MGGGEEEGTNPQVVPTGTMSTLFCLMYVIFPLNLVRREFYQTLCTDEKTEA